MKSSPLVLLKTGATGKRGARRIRVTAKFEVTFETDLEDYEYEALRFNEVPLDDFISDRTLRGFVADDGTCEAQWSVVRMAKKKTKKSRRRQ